MEINEVILMRDTLKAGKNIPVRVLMDNTHTIIDESNPSQFTKWDDDNGLLYSFRLVDMQGDTCPSNVQKAISVFVVHYASIQAMELPVLPLSGIDTIFSSMEATGVTMSDEFKKRIKDTFTMMLETGRAVMTHEDLNKVSGSNLDTSDDYYAGRYKQPFKETRLMASRNAYVDSLKEAEKEETP